MVEPAGFVVRELRQEDVSEARALMLRVVFEDFGEPHDPVIHTDVDDLVGW